MKEHLYPPFNSWKNLISRDKLFNDQELTTKVMDIINRVKNFGDQALYEYALKFDGCELKDLKISNSKIDKICQEVRPVLQESIDLAMKNIDKFHRTQLESTNQTVEICPGVKLTQEIRPINKVGLYIPGGSAPLISTLMMLAIPARIAGVKKIVVCTPPTKDNSIHPAIAYIAKKLELDTIFQAGGAQAISALAFGTESMPAVDKIFGPGNIFVTLAKNLITQLTNVSIDLPAGPSEVLVIADKSANPKFVASDLLAQAEHGKDSQVVLVTNEEKIIEQTKLELIKQLESLPRKDIIKESLKIGHMVLLSDIDQAVEFSNIYAPEHLILSVSNYRDYIPKITNAGAVFLGNYAPESAGDYASGSNHVLPTHGRAVNTSGVSVDSFRKKICFQEINQNGLENIGISIETLATAENLIAHKNAVSYRLEKL